MLLSSRRVVAVEGGFVAVIYHVGGHSGRVGDAALDQEVVEVGHCLAALLESASWIEDGAHASNNQQISLRSRRKTGRLVSEGVRAIEFAIICAACTLIREMVTSSSGRSFWIRSTH